jgi:hypothetical protein
MTASVKKYQAMGIVADNHERLFNTIPQRTSNTDSIQIVRDEAVSEPINGPCWMGSRRWHCCAQGTSHATACRPTWAEYSDQREDLDRSPNEGRIQARSGHPHPDGFGSTSAGRAASFGTARPCHSMPSRPSDASRGFSIGPPNRAGYLSSTLYQGQYSLG